MLKYHTIMTWTYIRTLSFIHPLTNILNIESAFEEIKYCLFNLQYCLKTKSGRLNLLLTSGMHRDHQARNSYKKYIYNYINIRYNQSVYFFKKNITSSAPWALNCSWGILLSYRHLKKHICTITMTTRLHEVIFCYLIRVLEWSSERNTMFEFAWAGI